MNFTKVQRLLLLSGVMILLFAGVINSFAITQGSFITQNQKNNIFFSDRFQTTDSPSKYYAYGDSISLAAQSGDLNDDGSDCYIIQMRDMHDPFATADHNMDGSGVSSRWGLDAIEEHYIKGTEYFFIEFGTNDYRARIPPPETAKNLMGMYQYVKNNGTTPYVLIPVLLHPENWTRDKKTWADNDGNITILQHALDEYGIPYIRTYDALDSSPNNLNQDSYNGTWMSDGIHPNRTGHRVMAEYLWERLYPRIVSEKQPKIFDITRSVKYRFGL